MRLRNAWQAGGCRGSEPPIPLILSGWQFSSDQDKQQRWQATLQWASERDLSNLIPEFKPDELYFTECLTTSYPEQHYRSDRYAVRERPSDEALSAALEVLKRDWRIIAGAELANVSEPSSFTGSKFRRLLVRVHSEYKPPWGTWDTLLNGPEREAFTTFRKAINDAIAPVCVDHIDFDIRAKP